MKYEFLILCLIFSIGAHAQSKLYTKQEIIYGRKDGMALTMVQLKPENNSNKRALIRIISGSWMSNERSVPRYVESYTPFLERGYSVFFVMHGSQPRYAVPDNVEDIKRAVRFIRYHAGEYGIDPDHIGIMGSSSGGHLALMIATAGQPADSLRKDPVDRVSSRVQAAAVLYPPTDFFNWGQTGAGFPGNEALLVKSRVAGAFDFRKWNDSATMYLPVFDINIRNQIYRDISPIYSVSPDDPPILILHGDKDKLVPLQQSESFIKKLNEAKVINSLIIKKDADHGWEHTTDEFKIFIDWFDKYLL